jgi:hypothetical protein
MRLKCDELLSSFAFNVNVRRFTEVDAAPGTRDSTLAGVGGQTEE